MHALLIIGLAIALLGVPVVLLLSKRMRLQVWARLPRFAQWGLAAVVVIITAAAGRTALVRLGIGWPTWSGFGLAILAAVFTIAAMGVHFYVQCHHGKPSRALHQYQALLQLSVGYRCFLVVTAAVVEEVLYRGYAIGIGQYLVGGLWVACALSVVAFTLAHYRWGVAHLVPVLVSAVAFTALFVYTGNLWVCIFAHALVDGVGFLSTPAGASSRGQRQASTSG